MSEEFGPPNCLKCGYAHELAFDCQKSAGKTEMTLDRLANLEALAIHARDRLGETHMELTIPLLLELIEAARLGLAPSSSVAAYWAGRCADAERRAGIKT